MMRRFMALGAILAGAIAIPSALAHTVKTDGQIAATFHLDPSHNARVGQPAQLWFALTRRGGVQVPLAACDCRLALYAQPRRPGDRPVLEPVLAAITAENQPGLPGATVTFERAGAYEVVLRGQPKTPKDFDPFELTFDTLVTGGSAAESPAAKASDRPTATDPALPADKTAPAKPTAPQPTAAANPLGDRRVVGTGVAIVGAGVAGLGWWVLARRDPRSSEAEPETEDDDDRPGQN